MTRCHELYYTKKQQKRADWVAGGQFFILMNGSIRRRGKLHAQPAKIRCWYHTTTIIFWNNNVQMVVNFSTHKQKKSITITFLLILILSSYWYFLISFGTYLIREKRWIINLQNISRFTQRIILKPILIFKLPHFTGQGPDLSFETIR